MDAIQRAVPRCRRCPELRAYCAEIAVVKRRAYAGWDYWAKPVPGFGDDGARIMIVGLAPAAHGANRTGRMFTGDRSGDFLYAALHRAGLANQPHAASRDDGLVLCNVYITAALRCAPPGNKPTPRQLDRCSSYLADELTILRPAVTVCLGSLAWNAVLNALRTAGEQLPRPKPKFAHGLECSFGLTVLLGCYHVSQQNTFTGRLTEPMIDAVLRRATAIAASRPMC
ncbi:MAG: uracil-DNA glycosylase [Planctomycetota bacterium]|nr:uracil-DNA glycosylase [Planctomycetota bacterium]MCZ6543651.1 uracil-DNA glycosylase [Planctomycetota bacterium]MCZ6612945.1 uracil-DNA glycosylase [Planctomycetota bacterium]